MKSFSIKIILATLILCLTSFPAQGAEVSMENSAAVSGNADPELKQAVLNLMSQFAATINSKRKEVIENFLTFYADRDAHFIKKSELYDNANPNDIVASENLDMERSEYGEYLYHISSTPLKYAILIAVDSVNLDERKNIYANLKIEEISLSEIKKEKMLNGQGGESKLVIEKSKVRIDVRTNCNVSFRQSSTLVITGLNCIEKMRVQ